MTDVHVKRGGERTFEVAVDDGTSTSRHRVTVEPATLEALGVEENDARTLVERSFAFLLEREPKESILSSFELSVIGRYFPEYSDEIRRRMSS